MYLPPHFREERLEAQHELIGACPLGILISTGAGGRLVANPVPFLLDAKASPMGTLRCHVARANPQWRDLLSAPECLVVFTGPQAYITPSWYPTKRAGGKVVPTWNYAMVHAWGRPVVIEEGEWLRAQVAALTDQQEARRMEPWRVDDAPEPYVSAQLRGIIGIEIAITRIEGKWKVSQNRPEIDRAGVAAGLGEQGGASADMRALVAGGGPVNKTGGRPEQPGGAS